MREDSHAAHPVSQGGFQKKKEFINQVWDVQGNILKSLNSMFDKFFLRNIFFCSHIF